MNEEHNQVLIEIRDILRELMEEQKQLMKDVRELREEQRKLFDEIRFNNFVLSNINIRSEIVN